MVMCTEFQPFPANLSQLFNSKRTLSARTSSVRSYLLRLEWNKKSRNVDLGSSMFACSCSSSLIKGMPTSNFARVYFIHVTFSADIIERF